MVAKDSAGNAMPAMVQRWRSPYFAGDPAVAGAASFRLEPRWRRAGVFLIDEAHQQAQSQPQIMVHVPMHQSGLDHDFFIYKYEASVYNGSGNNAAGPLQADASGNWLANAAQCEDSFNRTGSFNMTACGNNDLVRGIYKINGEGARVVLNGDAWVYEASWRGSVRGGSWIDGNLGGRYLTWVAWDTGLQAGDVGARCRR